MLAVLPVVGVLVLVVAVSWLLGSGGSRAGSRVVPVAAAQPIPSPPPPLDLMAVQATADAVFTRTPGALILPTPTPPAKPVAPAKPPAAAGQPPPPAKPALPTQPPRPTAPAQTPTPEPTDPPTRTPTTTPTATPTATDTVTETPTPLPSPCDAKTTVPRLATGNGFFVTFMHDVVGDLQFTWPAAGGRILVYADVPPELNGAESGTVQGVPSAETLAQGTGGPNTLNVPNRPPGVYTVLFFNAAADGVGPDDANIHYWTYGRCP